MPLKKTSDYALGDTNQKFCSHCTDEQGKLKPYKEVVKGMANYLAHSQGIALTAATELADSIISKLPAWKNHSK